MTKNNQMGMTRVLRATCPDTDGFRVHLIESEWDALVEDYEALTKERDEYKAKLDAELPAAWREDLASLDQLNERLRRERDEARGTEAALLEQRETLRDHLARADERWTEAKKERDEAHAALCLLRKAATEAKEYLDDSAPVGSDEWAVRQRLDVALYPESVGGEPLPGEGKP